MASGSSDPQRWVRPIEAAVRRHAAVAARFDHRVGARAGLKLSTCEANMVHLLLLRGPLSPGVLGKLSEMTSSGTITGVIDRLERAGYVERKRCVQDRRKVTVHLNQEWLDRENAARSQRLARLVGEYDEEQLAVVADFLTRLADLEDESEAH